MGNEIFESYGSDPIELCRGWLSEAEKTEINDPAAISLATATKDGRPSNRMVLIKEIEDSGLKFHTSAESRKGHEIADNPYGALCFHWKSTHKQIRIEGRIEAVSNAESDAYFLTRPLERKIGAWASQQSQSFENHGDLAHAVEEYTEKFKDLETIPRPPYWKGFRLIPASMEFWIGNRDRLHTRFVYTKEQGKNWTARWLYP